MSETNTVQRLKPNAVGLLGVLFMAVATAALITAMVGNDAGEQLSILRIERLRRDVLGRSRCS